MFRHLIGKGLVIVASVVCAGAFGAEQPTPQEQQEQYQRWLQSFHNWPVDDIKLDFNGLDKARFQPPPKPYVHPRVFINPEDVPALREKVKTSQVGQIAFGNIKQAIKGLYESDGFKKLVAGDESGAKDRNIDRLMANDALRCLIENDEAGAKQLAAAVTTLAKVRKNDLLRKGNIPPHQSSEGWNPLIRAQFSGVNSWQHWSMGIIDHEFFGYIYDFIYNWMTDQQRAVVRDAIATATQKEYSWAMGIAGPATHNWDVIHTSLGILCLSIEGEEGFDPKVAAWTKQILANYDTYGINDSGVPHERGGKNALLLCNSLPFSRRSYDGVIPVKLPDNLMAIPNVRRFATGYIMNLQAPWRRVMQMYGAWGGSDTPMSRWLPDIMAIKYAYPDDPTVDYVWRCSTGDDYQAIRDLKLGSHEFAGSDLIMAVLFGRDYSNKQTLDEQLAAIHPPLDFLCPQRLLLESRSDWGTDALQVYVHAQAMYSAHPRFSKGGILINGLGRPWTYYAHIADSAGVLGSVAEAQHYSVVLVDGVGMGFENAVGVDYVHNESGALVSVDDRIPFSWQQGKPEAGKAVWKEWADFTVAQMWPLYHPDRAIPGNDLRRVTMPDWDYPGHTGSAEDQPVLVERFPMQYAFRTAGLVRGKHPYVLVVDDYRKDDQPHRFDWQFIVQPDLLIESQDSNRIILKEKEGNRRLLIQALQVSGAESESTLAYMEDYAGYGWSDRPYERFHGKRLVVTSHAVEPQFKFIIYPFREGEALPEVRWNNAQADVQWPGQQDQIAFKQQANGLNAITLHRGGQQILSINAGVGR